jgi:hypothetical protein
MQEGPVDSPVHGAKAQMGYHRRSGGHAVTSYDWQQYLHFAEQHLQPTPPAIYGGSIGDQVGTFAHKL